MYRIDDKKFLYLIVFVLLVGILLPVSFSFYNNKIDVDVTTKTGNMICNFDIDNNNYVDSNGKYFYLNVYNYEKDKTNLTDTDISYKLIVNDRNNNNIKFRYNDLNNSILEIDGEFDNKDKNVNKYKIYIDNEDTKKVNVDVNVKLEAYQKKKS